MPRPSTNDHRSYNGGGRKSQREDLLKAAMDLFAKGGSRGTPLAAIAERIGVTTPAITHHFGTKRDLLMEVVRETDRANPSLFDHPEMSGLQRIDVLRQWPKLLLADSGLAHLSRLRMVMIAEALDPDFTAHEHFVGRHLHQQEQLAGVVSAGQQDGSIRPDANPDIVANDILAFMQGAQFRWFLDPDHIAIQAVFDGYFDRLVADLRRPRARRRS